MNVKGLTTSEVEVSKNKYGRNVIPEPEPTTFWDEFKETFGDPMIKILLAIVAIMIGTTAFKLFGPGAEPHSGILSILKEFIEPFGTLVAVFLVATISAKTAVSSDKAFRSLKDRTEKEKCKVLRDGIIQEVEFEDIVIGDVVKLQSGDKIPADGILIDGHLKVDNSALNGESEEAKKFADENATLPEQITGNTFVDKSSLFRGAIVTDGEGYMRIDKIALETMMGKMAEEMNADEVESPLKVKLGKLANQISIFGYVAAIAIVVVTPIIDILTHGQLSTAIGARDWPGVISRVLEIVSLAILIVVCAVPEGLPLMISLVLMQNTSKMLDHNVLVRKAIGIETAGSLNILFSDKTGTITKGQLEVVDFIDGSGRVKLPELGSKLYDKLCQNIVCSTQSSFDKNGNVFGGNMTDKALIKFIGKDKFEASSKEFTNKQDFNSANKFSQVEVDGTVLYKGAPEKIVEKCTKYLKEDGTIEDVDIENVNAFSLKLANEAKRLIAFAYKENTQLVENELQDDLILIGLAAIRDDVRPEAKEAIETVKQAGIQVVMITGDRLETAKAIAKDAGLIGENAVVLTEENKSEMLQKYKNTTTEVEGDGLVVSSDMLNKLTDDEVKVLVSGIKVIARALPTDKSRMVRLCQELNLVCGMTGDGVNDSPALKKADVGFAMGSGTEAAKEAGDLVIIDDNFKSIKDAIWYGRTIYHNILKFIKFQLCMNVVAVLATLIMPNINALGGFVPLSVVMLLFVNLCCDSLASLIFGGEPADEKYLRELPRRRDESILNVSRFMEILIPALVMTAIGIVWSWIIYNKTDMKTLCSLFFVYYIVSSLLNGFNYRSEKFDIFRNLKSNKNFIVIPLLIVAALFVIVFTPIADAFGGAPIRNMSLFGLTLLVSLTGILPGFILKIFKR